MTNEQVNISEDSNGTPTLFLKGSWSLNVEDALASKEWQALAVFGVDWPDYKCLVPFAKKISWLRVPFGPDSSEGLDQLSELSTLEVTDVLRPQVDFRKLPKLRWLETIWDSRSSNFVAHEGIEVLIVHAVKGQDLEWIPNDSKLRVLQLRGGTLQSLAGLEDATQLQELYATDLKRCASIDSITALRHLRVLEIDAPKAEIEDVNWACKMPKLSRLMLSSRAKRIDWKALAAHQALSSIAITAHEGYDVSDQEIERQLESNGRKLISFKRFKSKCPGFAIELERVN